MTTNISLYVYTLHNTVVMTFNPTLFLAVVLGYLVGDFVCCDYKLDRKINPSSSVLPQQQTVSSSPTAARFEVRWIRGLLRRLLLLPPSSTINNTTNADGEKNTAVAVDAAEEEDIYAIFSSTPVRMTQWTLWLAPRVAR